MQFIDSVQNKRAKQWRKLLTHKEREESRIFLVEGFHLVEEAIKSGAVFELIIGPDVNVPVDWKIDNIPTFQVCAEIAKSLSDTGTSQNIFATCRQIMYKISWEHTKTVLMIDAVQDPGNVGALIRTADAAGINMVILGEGCADRYNPKTLRASQGSIFHLPVLKLALDQVILDLQATGTKVIGSTMTNATSLYEIEHPERFALIVGNEGSGVSRELLKKSDQNIFVPIFGRAESLNVAVATGIMLYELKK